MGRMFYVSGRTISTWVSHLKKAKEILWVHPKGRYRTLWAKRHPDVRLAEKLLYMDREISKEAVVKGHAAEILLGKNLRGGIEEYSIPTTKDDCNQVGRNLPHTINTTMKDITEKTTATPTPLPAGGQAPALLEDRTEEQRATIEQLKETLGTGGRRAGKMSQGEFNRRREGQKRALLGDKKN